MNMGWWNDNRAKYRRAAGIAVTGIALAAMTIGTMKYCIDNKKDFEKSLAKEPVVAMVYNQGSAMISIIKQAQDVLADKNAPFDRLNEVADSMATIAKAVSKPLSHKKEIEKAIEEKNITEKNIDEVELLKKQISALSSELSYKRLMFETKMLNDQENARLSKIAGNQKPFRPI